MPQGELVPNDKTGNEMKYRGTDMNSPGLLRFGVCKMEIKTVILLWKKSNIHLMY